MKNSNVRWIGEIPNDWMITKLGSHFKCRNVKVDDISYPPLSVTKMGILPQMDTVAKSDANDNRKQVLSGDFVINSRSDRKQSCGVSKLTGSVSLINTILYQPNQDYDNGYVSFLLKNYGFAEEFYRWGHGIVADLWTTRWQEMKDIDLPFPPTNVQKKIAYELQNKIKNIDSLVLNETKQIEKLEEYKKAVITKAVTKGLDPNVKMKDSGVEWVGNIPCNWKIVHLSSLFYQLKNKNKGMACNNLLSLSYGNVVRRDINKNDGLLPENFEGYNITNEGDIVLRLTDLQNDHKSLRTGYCTEKGIITSAYITLRKKQNINTHFVRYYLHAFDIQKGFYGLGDGVRQGLTFDGIKTLPILLPPLEEQNAIENFLNVKCSEIKKLILLKEQTIERLKDYRKSLIFEYVTGKKEVL